MCAGAAVPRPYEEGENGGRKIMQALSRADIIQRVNYRVRREYTLLERR